MYFSAERLALANQSLRETFHQCSIAWQAIPHWDTKDPGQVSIPNGILGASASFLTVAHQEQPFELTVAEVIAPTPDALLTALMTATHTLAKKVDDDVLPQLYGGAPAPNILATAIGPGPLQDTLITARATVEDAGYRAPSCLLTNTAGLTKLSQLVSGVSILQGLLTAANINSLYRSTVLDPPDPDVRLALVGRRRRIPQGAAPEASPGEEPVDLAVSLPPSLEVNGETGTGTIQLTVRIRYALRITDATGLVAVHHP
jgi:hypothetical protein